jgi:hypothetical protein
MQRHASGLDTAIEPVQQLPDRSPLTDVSGTNLMILVASSCAASAVSAAKIIKNTRPNVHLLFIRDIEASFVKQSDS